MLVLVTVPIDGQLILSYAGSQKVNSKYQPRSPPRMLPSRPKIVSPYVKRMSQYLFRTADNLAVPPVQVIVDLPEIHGGLN